MPEFDLSALFKQAQALQEKLSKMQEEAAARTVEAAAGGGMVRVVVDGSLRLRSIQLDPAILAANDRDMLQDLIVVAVNDGLHRAQEMVASEVGKLSPFGNLGGLNLPGLFGGGGNRE